MGLISLDQEKAFDRVEHYYLWKTLQAFGFSSDFIGYIKVLYNDIESVLRVNGGLCAPFKVCRGVRQGCSLSGILYTLAIEPLLNKLRRVLEGVSLQVCKSTLVLSAYADDVVIVLNKQNDVDTLLKTLREFEIISSAKINWSKSEAVLVGKWERRVPILPNGLIWKKDGFKYLGVFLGDETIVQRNWEGITEKLKGRLMKWKWIVKNISYRGRTLIINNLVASSLWHRLACIEPPACLLAKIQSILIDFFWDKMHWVPHNVLYLPKEEGGQGLVHLQSRTAAFRLQFIQRFLTGPKNLSWRPVASMILKTAEGLCLDKSLFLLNPQKINTSKMPEFYRNLFKVWDLFQVKRTDSTSSLFWLLKEPLIYGSRLDFLGGFGALMEAFLNLRL
ncbi:putative 149 kDa protein [Labeo rohita]|uniref:149 kDa protein n=1 Tax=Labeo rohita TaxID=84645 RepID=A0ABQ8L8E5_LABRO|nr:putative 149 kDa protein [Labeo rohita]